MAILSHNFSSAERVMFDHSLARDYAQVALKHSFDSSPTIIILGSSNPRHISTSNVHDQHILGYHHEDNNNKPTMYLLIWANISSPIRTGLVFNERILSPLL